MFDPTRIEPALRGALSAAFERVLASGRYVLGPEVEAFERAAAERVGVPFAVGVSSGSDALLVALMALGVGPGDEVVVPAYTFFSPAGAVARLGATPVFADVTPCCLTLAAGAVEPLLTPRTRAIVPVHLFGQCAAMEPLAALAVRRGLPLVEDAAQAFGARAGDRAAGVAGALGCFSFFPTKNLGGLGDGGLVTTSDPALADRVALLRAHGARPKYHHIEIGGNFRLDALHAALLRAKLPFLDAHLAERAAIARRYDEALLARGVAEPGPTCAGGPRAGGAGAPLLLPSTCRAGRTFHQYVVRVRGEGARDRLRAGLAERGVETHVYYPEPLHLAPCFTALARAAGGLPVAEAAARDSLALPLFPGLRDGELEHVVAAIASLVR
jgi:dTDP-4-amino-4,6-dideoxygalactose transaminase